MLLSSAGLMGEMSILSIVLTVQGLEASFKRTLEGFDAFPHLSETARQLC